VDKQRSGEDVGYTLPVFAVAAAKAALQWLLLKRSVGEGSKAHQARVTPGATEFEGIERVEPGATSGENDRPTPLTPHQALHPSPLSIVPPTIVMIDLADGSGEVATVTIEQVARLNDRSALGITRSNPGQNLDLTRNTPVWAHVTLISAINSPEVNTPKNSTPIDTETACIASSLSGGAIPSTLSTSMIAGEQAGDRLILVGGDGIGQQANGQPAIYAYARRLFVQNLAALLADLPEGERAIIRIILPEGEALAQRTSNAAFGVIDGLSLLGTRGMVVSHTEEETLTACRDRLRQLAKTHDRLAFCLGSHGQAVVTGLGIDTDRVVMIGNWTGALLAEAAMLGVRSLLLIGYHGKLIKLAGGIFNTSSHVADGRLEILTAIAATVTADIDTIRSLLTVETVAAAEQILRNTRISTPVFTEVAQRVATRAMNYAAKYGDRVIEVEVMLFGRRGEPIAQTIGSARLVDLLQATPSSQEPR